MTDLARAGLAAYLLGSVPFSYLLARVCGVDLRTIGSGNVGATNVFRALGVRWGVLALALDMGKGLAAVAYATSLGLPETERVVVAALAVLGHVFPLFLGFRGGKGVATAGGAFLGLEPLAVSAAIGVFAVVVAVTRYVSLGSLLAATTLATLLVWMRGPTHPTATLALCAWLLLVIRHRTNIGRLLAGTESRLDGLRAEPV